MTAGAELPDARRVERQARRLLVPAEPHQQGRAPLERAEHVEPRNAAARPLRHAVFDRQHDGRPVKRIDQLRGDDADDAAVPAVAGDDEDRSRADVRIGLTIFLAAATISASSSCRRTFLAIELHRQRPHLLRHRLVGGQQEPRRDVRRAHAAGRVDARRQHERDVIAVDRLPGQAGHVEQRAQADLVRAARQQVEADLRDDAVLADERHDVGQRADGGDLDEARQPALAPGLPAERLHQLQGHADARQVLVRIRAVVALGVDDGERRRQLGVRLVVIRDDQVDAELARARAASAPRMPQSTETTSATPSACSRSIAAGCRP